MRLLLETTISIMPEFRMVLVHCGLCRRIGLVPRKYFSHVTTRTSWNCTCLHAQRSCTAALKSLLTVMAGTLGMNAVRLSSGSEVSQC